MEARFDENEIRAAERILTAALEAADPTAWVTMYTEDALFVGPGAPAVEGRAALLQMARAMNPLSSVVITQSKPRGTATWPVFTAAGRGSTDGCLTAAVRVRCG